MNDIVSKAFADAIVEAAIPKFRQIIKEEIHNSKSEDLQEKFLSVDETMKMFFPPISRGTLYNWERDGRIKSYLMAGRRLYKYSEVLESIQRIKKYSRS